MNIHEINNLKNALESVSKKEMEQRKTIKKLLIKNKKLKKQFSLHDVSQQRELLDGLLFHLEQNSYIEGSFLSRDKILKEYLQTI